AEAPPPAPLTTPAPAEPLYNVMLSDAGADAAALKKAVTEITGQQDDAKLTAIIASKLIITGTLPKATDAQAKLVKAGAKVDLVKVETSAPAPAPVTPPKAPEGAAPAPAPATAPTTPAAPAPATAPAPAPAAPAPAPAPAAPAPAHP
ncbi:MAG TPA: 2-oxoglutarate dehydrogenase, E2 component, dihydrolipoamide succinyltransferase, partial [Planctomycetota bacterium]|nr:2-oxoglutarate dehydrogenase, E2 component, dihydrolipoamide succinyltransferase [Planctomycetota bacterium]